ncbi:MAG: CopG family ribbon-helix-helix protein, partial [Candidatus Ranarchaeia archaeon]
MVSKKAELQRLTISLPSTVVDSLNQIQRQLGHVSRSAAIRAAIREYVA